MANKCWNKHGVLILVVIYLLSYGLFSASFLTGFPFVHSDESWLAGLTRDMMASRSFGVTESVFDAKPRIPHAIKLLFHGLQMVCLSVFGYDIQSVRLLSLTAALAALLLIWRIGKQQGGSWFGFFLMSIVSLDIQFLYASHFARQEILLCCSLAACLLILLRCFARPTVNQALLLGIITGLSVGIHPNSFLLAVVCGIVMSIPILQSRGNGCAPLLVYIIVTGMFAGLFIGLSYWFQPEFLSNYFRLGREEFELHTSVSGRITELFEYFQSIYNRESGTYYLPDLRLEMLGFVLITCLLIPAYVILRNSENSREQLWCSHTGILASCLLGLLLGTVLIGRYNQLSIVFFLLVAWLLTGQFFLLLERRGRLLLMTFLWVVLAYGSREQVLSGISAPSYETYLEQISELIPADSHTIGNLNMEFYFDRNVLKDYRNLPYLEDFDGFRQYAADNHIQYICCTDELDFIYEHRPYYHAIYGNAGFIKDLKEYCEVYCEPVGTFQNPQYAARVISLLQNPDYETVTVYQVKETP